MIVFLAALLMILGLIGRMVYLMVFDAEYYQKKAEDLHERERKIKAARGEIIDTNGTVLATNRTVCTISVIHSQIKEPEVVIKKLSKCLGMEEAEVRKRVKKVSSMERIKTNVDKETGDKIREMELAGVKVDEDFKRYYPYNELASKVIGFTGGDNQGIIGLEVRYEDYLKGSNGRILTTTDARGIELEGVAEDRVEPVPGNDLVISLDYNIQMYAQQEAEKVMEAKGADYVSILILNPQNGEIYACVNVPEFDLNDPFTLNTGVDTSAMTDQQKQDTLNQMWRNQCVNDTYEPGSTFKMLTVLEYMKENPNTWQDYVYNCNGSYQNGDYTIKCYHGTAHGAQNLIQAFANSCNGAFAEIGMQINSEKFRALANQMLFNSELPYTLPYNQSTFSLDGSSDDWEKLQTAIGQGKTQITPLHNLMIVSAIANGGTLMKPYMIDHVENVGGQTVKKFLPSAYGTLMSANDAQFLTHLMSQVVEIGTGSAMRGTSYTVAGKTGSAEFETGKETHSWFVGFAPADKPKVAICVLAEESGSGGAVAAPIARQVLDRYFAKYGQ